MPARSDACAAARHGPAYKVGKQADHVGAHGSLQPTLHADALRSRFHAGRGRKVRPKHCAAWWQAVEQADAQSVGVSLRQRFHDWHD